MTKKRFCVFILAAALSLLMSCATAASTVEDKSTNIKTQPESPQKAEQDFTAITGKDWKLTAVFIDGKATSFNRDKLTSEAYRDFFTLSFNADNFGIELVGGRAAPNHYNAPYSFGSGQSISIKLIRSTQMALLSPLDILSELDYFTYLQNTHTWKLTNDTLEFLSKTREGVDVRLVFSVL